MNKIEKLIEEFCPQRVEFKALGEVCEIQNGGAFKSSKFNNDGIGVPIIRIRDLNSKFSNTYYSGQYDNKFLLSNEDLLIGMDGDFRAVLWQHGKAILNQRVCRLQNFDGIIKDYIYYYIQPELTKIQNSTQASTVKHSSFANINSRNILAT